MNGIATGKSNYENYAWMPELTIPFAERVCHVLGIDCGKSLLDFGCARGYAVRAFREFGIDAYGYDISEWAISECDPEVKDRVSNELPDRPFDFVISKDVLEHVPESAIARTVAQIIARVNVASLFIVPLAMYPGGDYVREADRFDITHKIRLTLEGWMNIVSHAVGDNWSVSGSWHIPGLKPTSHTQFKSCGFIIARRHNEH